MLVTCPSGFSFELRPLKTKEANVLADAMAQKKGVVLDSILSSVYVRTADNGPYSFPGAPVWDDVLTGDRAYAQLKARVATHGGGYDFQISCGHCKENIRWNIDLNDLPVQQLSDSDKASFIAGNKLVDIGPDGLKYTFHLNTGKHERRAQAILKANPSSKLSASLISRIDAIEGVTDVRTYIEDLDWGTALDVLDMLDGHDCGIRTDIEVSCPHCDATNEVDVPFAQIGYWAPRSKSRKSSS